MIKFGHATVRQLPDLWILLNGFYFYVTDICDLYQWLWLQFYLLLMMGSKDTRNMYSDFAVQ